MSNKYEKCYCSELVDFCSHQYCTLKEIINNSNEKQKQQIVKPITDIIILMENKIRFISRDINLDQYHDYICDFYENQILKLRKQLNESKLMIKNQKIKIKELQTSEEILQQTFKINNNNYKLDYEVENQILYLKSQLQHSQKLLSQNTYFIQQQNSIIHQLTGQCQEYESKDKERRVNMDAKLKYINKQINDHHMDVKNIVNRLEDEEKKMQKEMKDLDLQNIHFLQERNNLEDEIIMKVEEIKLMSKKIYDISLVVSQLQRQLCLKDQKIIAQKDKNQLYERQIQAWKNKSEIISKQWQQKIYIKITQNKQLSCTIASLVEQNHLKKYEMTNLVQLNRKNMQEIKVERQKSKQIEINLRQIEIQFKKIQKEKEKYRLRVRQIEGEQMSMKEDIRLNDKIKQELRLEINQLIDDQKKIRKKYQKQLQKFKIKWKSKENKFKEEIEESSEQIKMLELELNRFTEHNKELQTNLKIYDKNLNTVNEAFKDMKLIVDKLHEQNEQLKEKVSILEVKLKQSNKQLIKMSDFEKSYFNLEIKYKNLVSKQQKYQQQQQQKNRDTQIQKKNENIHDKETIKFLKEDLSKKNFNIKQNQNKVCILQEQLRQIDHQYEVQKIKMQTKIKQLSQIIQQNYSFSNKLIETQI